MESMWTDYTTLLGVVRRCIAHLSVHEQAEVLAGTARRIYRL